MNFFEHQEKANKQTSILMVYFAVSVVLTILGVYFLILFASNYAGVGHVGGLKSGAESLSHHSGDTRLSIAWEMMKRQNFFNPEIFLSVTAALVSLIGITSLFKISQISQGGGAYVAQSLGGRLLDGGSSSPTQKRLLNVVEEMALASGVVVPPVYILDGERGINAFAAGFSVKDAVIGVTDGAVETLSRDELQGVIAHEFSHILNGDMRLNIKLMGVVSGILVIAILGRTLLYGLSYSGRSSREGKGGGVPLMLVAIGLIGIGGIGVLFGRLIKSAISRQREFLADASAIQFTRNPLGLATAFARIRALSSSLDSPQAEQVSHMFFAEGMKNSWFGSMDTHPPLEERVRRIGFDIDQLTEDLRSNETIDSLVTTREVKTRQGFGSPLQMTPQALADTVGMLNSESFGQALSLIDTIPEHLREMAKFPDSAKLIILALTLSGESNSFENQTQQKDLEVISRELSALSPEIRYALAEMSAVGLRKLSAPDYTAFREQLLDLIYKDDHITIAEYVVGRMVTDSLDVHHGLYPPPQEKNLPADTIKKEARTLISVLAYYGSSSKDEARAAFSAASTIVKYLQGSMILPTEEASLETLDNALRVLETSSPKIKHEIIKGCICSVQADGKITEEEYALLRAISSSLQCPMPRLDVAAWV